jgi:hypothetical protein
MFLDIRDVVGAEMANWHQHIMFIWLKIEWNAGQSQKLAAFHF